MTDKELRKKSRKELLEIMLEQSEYIDKLEKELEKTKKQLARKGIIMDESGSIAEASLKLHGVFVAAQKAADEYLLSIKMKEANQ